MHKTLTFPVYFSIFLLTVKFIEANQSKWSSGGPRVNGWRQPVHGGFNGQRPQTFRHPTHIHRHNNSGTSGTGCTLPRMGDLSKYEIRCIFPNSEQDEDCSLGRSNVLSSNTSVLLKCRHPYTSKQGDSLRIWACENGIWKGELKGFMCIRSSSSDLSPNDEAPTSTDTTTPATKFPPSWNSTKDQQMEGHTVKCRSLPKRTGVLLKCVSYSSTSLRSSSSIVSQSDCSTPQEVGTEAFYSCEQYYKASYGLGTKDRKCKDDGTWTGPGDDKFLTCALECGKPNPIARIPRITHGEPTYKAQWPWHAALFFKRDGKTYYEYHCGATLINRRAVLTAAHCVTELFSQTLKNISGFRVDLGRHERTGEDEHVQSYSAEDIIPHPNFNPVTSDSNIAIIILNEEVPIGLHVSPICYPQTKSSDFDVLVGSYGTIVGFGKNEDGDLNEELHMARLKVVGESDCAECFSGVDGGTTWEKSTIFCAGVKNATSVGSSDSGGGMYFPVDDAGVPRWYLNGIISRGIANEDGDCVRNQLSVYTRISTHAYWIGSVLSDKNAFYVF